MRETGLPKLLSYLKQDQYLLHKYQVDGQKTSKVKGECRWKTYYQN